jgi:hypothetical protein
MDASPVLNFLASPKVGAEILSDEGKPRPSKASLLFTFGGVKFTPRDKSPCFKNGGRMSEVKLSPLIVSDDEDVA